MATHICNPQQPKLCTPAVLTLMVSLVSPSFGPSEHLTTSLNPRPSPTPSYPPPPPPRPPPAPFATFGEKAEKRGHSVWTGACLHMTHTAQHTLRTCAEISQPNPSKHNNKNHLSSSAQLRYHLVACILIDRHQIEPLANLPHHVEELDNFIAPAFCMAGRNSSSVVEAHAFSIHCPD